MAKNRKQVLRAPVENTAAPGRPSPPPPAVPPGDRASRWALAALSMAILVAFAWGVLCIRAAGHCRAGEQAAREGKLMEAAREFESAVGCYAPFNPFSRAAAEEMLFLALREKGRDPVFSAEVLDRLGRAIRSTRWLVQPYPKLLAAVSGTSPHTLPHDPRIAVFFVSWLGLLAGMGAWWLPLRLPVRAVLGVTGMGFWAVLLYLC